MKRKENYIHEKKEFDKCEGNVKKQWNIAKNKMFNKKI